jgi:hypothetical protein
VATINIPTYALRGLMARIARRDGKNLDLIGPKDVNAILDKSKYNQLTPAQQWTPNLEMKKILDELKAGPFPKNPIVMQQYGFEYWYNYFYQQLYSSNDQMKYALPVIKADGSFYSENEMPRKREVLQEMLELGFYKYQTGDHLSAEELRTKILKGREKDPDVFVILFRGDGRSPQRIRADHGCKAQTTVQRLRSERGVENDWHPFKHAGNNVWFRKGLMGDNCLFSAVSVTPQFEIATKFPLLQEVKAQNPNAVGHAIVVVRPVDKITSESDKMMSLDSTKTNVYGVRVVGAYDTQKLQSKFHVGEFPEFASDQLCWSDHLVWFSITRIHFPDHGGHLIIVNEYKFLQRDDLLLRLLGGNAAQALRDWVLKTVQKGRLSGGVGGIHCRPAGPDLHPKELQIIKVMNPYIPGVQGLAA